MESQVGLFHGLAKCSQKWLTIKVMSWDLVETRGHIINRRTHSLVGNNHTIQLPNPLVAELSVIIKYC